MKTSKPISVLAEGLDVSELVDWITAIPLTDWPKGDLTQLKPAMVTNPEWHGLKQRTDALVTRLLGVAGKLAVNKCRQCGGHKTVPIMPAFGVFVGEGIDLETCRACNGTGSTLFDKSRWLSVVMPGHEIEPHADAAEPDWVRRVHVPLTTNAKAIMVADGVPYHLEVGKAYLFDKTCRHAVTNDGETPRIHFMFELMRRES